MKDNIKSSGLKLTPQRMAIIEFLEGNTSHPSADDVYCAVKKQFPGISFATVYNNLETLYKHGMLKEVSIDAQRKRFDPDTSEHHHIICRSCGRVGDVYQDFDIRLPKDMLQGFPEIISTKIEFFGLCSNCKANNTSL